MEPLIIEVAINGPPHPWKQHHNANFPILPEEIARDAMACLKAGASVIHNHIDQNLSGQAAADRYAEAYRPILKAFPDAILCPSLGAKSLTTDVDLTGAMDERCSHFEAVARQGGARMAIADPGSVTFNAGDDPDGLPAPGDLVYINTYKDTKIIFDEVRRCGLGPMISVFDPTFLRAALAYKKAGRLPPGAMTNLYFGGDYSLFVNGPTNCNFGLPPTRKAFEAYLEMIGDSGLTWGVAVLGADAVATGVARMAIEAGGHVRVGLEDYRGPRKPSNPELVAEVVSLAAACSRPVADHRSAARILGLPARTPAPA